MHRLHKHIRLYQGRAKTAGRDCLLQDYIKRLTSVDALAHAVATVQQHEAQEEVKRAKLAEEHEKRDDEESDEEDDL